MGPPQRPASTVKTLIYRIWNEEFLTAKAKKSKKEGENKEEPEVIHPLFPFFAFCAFAVSSFYLYF
jgi:hypothetical protein